MSKLKSPKFLFVIRFNIYSYKIANKIIKSSCDDKKIFYENEWNQRIDKLFLAINESLTNKKPKKINILYLFYDQLDEHHTNDNEYFDNDDDDDSYDNDDYDDSYDNDSDVDNVKHENKISFIHLDDNYLNSHNPLKMYDTCVSIKKLVGNNFIYCKKTNKLFYYENNKWSNDEYIFERFLSDLKLGYCKITLDES